MGTADFFWNSIRVLFSWIDIGVYNLISSVYELIVDMTKYRIFDSNDNFLINKIYTLLSIFMLFKVSFSFINYLINPDSFTDKEKGVQKIILNVVIMFILLVVSPWAFGKMWELQDTLLNENVIGKFVFSDDGDSFGLREYKWANQCIETSNAKTDGDYIALMILRGFYQPYDDVTYEVINSNAEALCAHTDSGTPGYYLSAWILNSSSGGLFGVIGDEYIMKYTIIISTAVGVVALLILVSFAMDVGLRVIKLSFLQLIAPIPIVSYVDPNSHKNGMFIKWLKEVGATWVSVFVRLFALFFAVRIIQELGKGQLRTIDGGERDPGLLITVFLIIGALMFAKQLPKLISDITGIKLDGGFNINPLKKIENEALFGKQALGVGAAGVASAMGGGANLLHRLADENTWKNGMGRGVLKTAGSAIAGATSAGYRTFGKVSKDGNVFGGIKNGHLEAMFAKQQREDLARRGSSFGGRLRADANRWIGRLNEAQQNILDFDEEEQRIKIEKEQRTAGLKEYSDIINSMNDKINAQIPVKNAQSAIDAAKQNGEYFNRYGEKTQLAHYLDDNLINEKAKAVAQLKSSADMVAWQKRLDYLVNNSAVLRQKVDDGKLNPTGIKADGTIDVKAIYDARAEITAVDMDFAQREIELKERKESFATKRADADNASRKISGPQPEGWKPSTNVNEGGTRGYGGNQWYNNKN